jgi:hypothetical protein
MTLSIEEQHTSLILRCMTSSLDPCQQAQTGTGKRKRVHLPSFCSARYEQGRLGRRQLSWGM